VSAPDLSEGSTDFVVENGTPLLPDATLYPFVNVAVQPSREGPPKVRIRMSVAAPTGRTFVYATFTGLEADDLVDAITRALEEARRNAG
jgi:hypothetical protein